MLDYRFFRFTESTSVVRRLTGAYDVNICFGQLAVDRY